jgi:ABC-type sugar transport system permease subunit
MSRLPRFPAYYAPIDKLGWWALRAFGIALLGFLLLPILVIVPLSFSASSFLAYPMPGWSLQWYQNLFTSSDWARAAKNSFIVAPAATFVATVLGTLTAVGLARICDAARLPSARKSATGWPWTLGILAWVACWPASGPVWRRNVSLIATTRTGRRKIFPPIEKCAEMSLTRHRRIC